MKKSGEAPNAIIKPSKFEKRYIYRFYTFSTVFQCFFLYNNKNNKNNVISIIEHVEFPASIILKVA